MIRIPRVKGWRGVTLCGFAAAGALFATSALNSGGLDLRASSVTDLNTLVYQEKLQVDSQQQQISALNAEISALSGKVADKRIARVQRAVDKVKGPAGLEPVAGAGVTVALSDAPKKVLDQAVSSGQATADELVVHQQDIQAVVNALWQAGAQAITIQGQRVISTTGIKCVGNTVVLHGVPYSPPYVISAVGDQSTLVDGLNNSDYVAAYMTFVRTYQLGWSLQLESDLKLPAYVGSTDLTHATVDPVGTKHVGPATE